jgi:hypothetical protein
MAELWALLPADGAAHAYAAIDTCARHAATPHDPRTADQRRADAAVDLLCGTRPTPTAHLNVTVPLTTLLAAHTIQGRLGGPDTPPAPAAGTIPEASAGATLGTTGTGTGPPDTRTTHTTATGTSSRAAEAAGTASTGTGTTSTAPTGPTGEAADPANTPTTGTAQTRAGPDGAGPPFAEQPGEYPGQIPGLGPIPASIARRLAADGIWRWLAVDHGTLVGVGTRGYRPPAALATLIRGRDRTCRFPGCRQPTHRCDLDHTIPYPHGPTDPDNLPSLCRHHHRLKHQTQWTVSQHPGGRLTWTSPTGRTYTTRPPDAA